MGAVEVFGGAPGDPKTLAAHVTKLRERFGRARVVLVGDRGLSLCPVYHRLADRVRAHMLVTFSCLVPTYDAADDRDIGENLFFVSDADAQLVGRFLRKA